MVKTDPRWIEAGPRPMLIGGKWRTGEGGKSFKVISPFTNEPLTRRSALTVGSTCIEYASIVDRMFFVANVIRPATGGQVAGPKDADVIVVGWVGQRVNVGRTRTRDLASVRASSDRLTTGPPSLLGLLEAFDLAAGL